MPYWLLHVSTDASEHIGVLPVPLAEYEKLREMHNIMHGDVSASSILLAFADPSNLPDYPGWPLRNLLLMVAQRWRLPHVRVSTFKQGVVSQHVQGSFAAVTGQATDRQAGDAAACKLTAGVQICGGVHA